MAIRRLVGVVCLASLVLVHESLASGRQETEDDSPWFDPNQLARKLKRNVFGQSRGKTGQGSDLNFLQKLTKDFDSELVAWMSADSSAAENQAFANSVKDAMKGSLSSDGETIPDSLDKILHRTKEWLDHENVDSGFGAWDQRLQHLWNAFKPVQAQLEATFAPYLEEGLTDFLLIQAWYYLEHMDSIKTPTWKRKQHLFYPTINDPSLLEEMHDALYLTQLSYVDEMDRFRQGLKKFRNATWELLSGTTTSYADLPAHFLLIHKHLEPLKPRFRKDIFDGLQTFIPWLPARSTGSDSDTLQLALLVRGTKDLSDALADGLLEPAEYRGGYAHAGILQAGKNLASKQLPRLKEVLEVSGRSKIHLYIVGHSLGAGAGAIAAMELNEIDFIDVEAVGFGCPSLISRSLAASTKDYITTIVSDGDVIPRMSGASMVNALLDVMEFNFTESFFNDVNFTLTRAKNVFAWASLLPSFETILSWLQETFDSSVHPRMEAADKFSKAESVLYPPGTCLHLFRDGQGYMGSFTPCEFFSEIDITRTMVDDHLVMPGYHKAMITMMRDLLQEDKFTFPHDIGTVL